MLIFTVGLIIGFIVGAGFMFFYFVENSGGEL